jgi:hypothetical protein
MHSVGAGLACYAASGWAAAIDTVGTAARDYFALRRAEPGAEFGAPQAQPTPFLITPAVREEKLPENPKEKFLDYRWEREMSDGLMFCALSRFTRHHWYHR